MALCTVWFVGPGVLKAVDSQSARIVTAFRAETKLPPAMDIRLPERQGGPQLPLWYLSLSLFFFFFNTILIAPLYFSAISCGIFYVYIILRRARISSHPSSNLGSSPFREYADFSTDFVSFAHTLPQSNWSQIPSDDLS